MKRKVGTIVDEELLKRAKVRAAQEGKAFSELLGAALETYLSRRAGASGERFVDEGWGPSKGISSKLESVPDGSPVFIDSSIFIYYFTAASPSRHAFLKL